MEATGINLGYVMIVFGLPILSLIGIVVYLRKRNQSDKTEL
jgi:LPXTG-motif cell wall-anchored protein